MDEEERACPTCGSDDRRTPLMLCRHGDNPDPWHTEGEQP